LFSGRFAALRRRCYYKKMCIQRPLTIGVLSDTHLPYRMAALPADVFDALAGVDLILHAGDVDDIDYLSGLRQIAPLHAVRGNIHVGDRSFGGRNLPAVVQLAVAGRKIVMAHGHRPGLGGLAMKGPDLVWSRFVRGANHRLNFDIARRLGRQFPAADVVIFGHTHAPFRVKIGTTLFFNPGAVAFTGNRRPSLGRLRISPEAITAEIVWLAH